ncbi:hypothetical protein B0H13DRAFT_2307734 [Mycena leptocephala]|nr:hypothetical protein B0H13DRAFT_2307734 [Mycena leptocephala]
MATINIYQSSTAFTCLNLTVQVGSEAAAAAAAALTPAQPQAPAPASASATPTNSVATTIANATLAGARRLIALIRVPRGQTPAREDPPPRDSDVTARRASMHPCRDYDMFSDQD